MLPLLCDAHVHVGSFKDGVYYTPEKIANDMRALGVEKWIFSSTSTGNEPWNVVKEEIETVMDISEGSAYPFLWVTPHMLKDSPDLKKYLFRNFSGIKIHGYQNVWAPNGKPLNRIFKIAEEMSLPIMLHTGSIDRSDAGVYETISKKFTSVKVILAHGRPLDEALRVMYAAPNTFVDTAFMETRDIRKLLALNLTPRVLFGTDYPITSYFYSTPAKTYYKRRIKSIKNIIGEEAFQEINSNIFKIIR